MHRDILVIRKILQGEKHTEDQNSTQCVYRSLEAARLIPSKKRVDRCSDFDKRKIERTKIEEGDAEHRKIWAKLKRSLEKNVYESRRNGISEQVRN